MQDFTEMSDPMSWHPVHRTFSMNVWCFVIAQLMAIFGWLKIWLAGAFNHGLQPDLLISQGDLTSCYKRFDWKIDLGFSRCPSPAECFYKKGLRKPDWTHNQYWVKYRERARVCVCLVVRLVGHSSHPLMIELDWFVVVICHSKLVSKSVCLLDPSC